MDTQTITLDQFITEQQLVMSVRPIKRNPHMQEQMPRNFNCTIEFEGRGYHEPLTVYFCKVLHIRSHPHLLRY